LETASEAENVERNNAIAAADYGTGGAQQLIIQMNIIIILAVYA
jgi:hypothetical protein